jgi:hypothetical protein
MQLGELAHGVDVVRHPGRQHIARLEHPAPRGGFALLPICVGQGHEPINGLVTFLEVALERLGQVALVVGARRHPSLGVDRGPGLAGLVQDVVQPHAEVLALLVVQVVDHLQHGPGIRGRFPARLLVSHVAHQGAYPLGVLG